VVKEIEIQLGEKALVNIDWIDAKSVDVKECIGCMICFNKSESLCPLKDDVHGIRQRLVGADGIVLVSPVYALHVSGSLKKLVDRLSFLFHRPELIGIPVVTIVTTEGGGHKQTQKYLRLIASGWGGQLVGQISIISPLYFSENKYHNEKYSHKMRQQVSASADKFFRCIQTEKLPIPSYYDIATFHGLKSKTMMSTADYDFWEERGWLKSDYYYPTKVSLLKKLLGKVIDKMICRMYKKIYYSNVK